LEKQVRGASFEVKTMHNLIPFVWAAGGVQLLIASVNFFLPRQLDYRGNLARLTPIVREVFVVQAVYIVLVLVALAGLCFGFAEDLAGGSTLGRALSGFLTLFWGLRFLIQLFYYEGSLKRQRPLLNLGFLLAFAYLTGVFGAAALGLV
jgi:hypothetical protein